MRHLLRFAFAAVAAIIIVGCQSTPSYVIPPKKMSEVMADIHIGEAVAESGNSDLQPDSARQALKQAILARHNVTLEQFDTSLYWYGRNVETFMEVNEMTINLLSERLKEAQKVGSSSPRSTRFSQEGDSVNIWTGPTTIYFSEKSPSQVVNFFHTSDRNWERGDRYTLRLKAVDAKAPVDVVIAVEYSDGTGEYLSGNLTGEGMRDMEFYLDSARVAVNLYGMITYLAPEGSQAVVDSISLVRTRTRNNSLHSAASAQKTLRYR